MTKKKIFGKIIIVGRTNVGKSTLLNQLIKSKISIISKKKNTTQTHVTGIYTSNFMQCELIDSPGLNYQHQTGIEKKRISETYNIIRQSNMIIFLITCFVWTEIEQKLLEYIQKNNYNYVIVINKIDLINNKKLLLPFLDKMNKIINNHEIILISAKKKKYLKELIFYIKKSLPISNHKYSYKKKTTCTKKFLIQEIIRETLIHLINQELVYSFQVHIIKFHKNIKNQYIIISAILVNNLRHKKMFIGSNGKKIKQCNKYAKKKIETFFKKKIYLNIQVQIQ